MTKTAAQYQKLLDDALSARMKVHNEIFTLVETFESRLNAYKDCHNLPTKTQKSLASALNKAHKALDSKIHKLWCDAFDAPETED